MTSEIVLDALEQALYARRPINKDELVHHSNQSSQYLSIKYTRLLSATGTFKLRKPKKLLEITVQRETRG